MHRFSPLLTRRRAALVLAAAIATAAVGLGAASQAKPVKPAAPAAVVTKTDIGAISIGAPGAKVTLVEYFSYTCGHCATFAAQSAAPLKTLYGRTVRVEYRNLVRDPLDMTAALLARCGGPRAFLGNHNAIFAAQAAWMGKAGSATEAQMKSWYEGSVGTRAKRIAADTGLTALMRARGYGAAQLDACLDSEVAQAEISAMTNLGRSTKGLDSTPSFLINGTLIDVHDWPNVKSRLDRALAGR